MCSEIDGESFGLRMWASGDVDGGDVEGAALHCRLVHC